MTTLPQNGNTPLPAVDDRSAPFWKGVARGTHELPRCEVCGTHNHPMLDECRVCLSPQLAWEDVGPVARLYSWAFEGRGVIQGFTQPYVIAQVTPEKCDDDGVRLIGTVLADPTQLQIGQRLELHPARVPGSDIHIAEYRPI